MKRHFQADHLWTADGWSDATQLVIDPHGNIASIAPAAPGSRAQRMGRFVLPGMPNIHSHAFQRAMAGLAERQAGDQDSFWTWRELMYGFASRITPDQLRDIAAQLYLEMLRAGYTSVCEFHYLHHPVAGTRGSAMEMSLALVEAARETGIGLTLLPVLYMAGGFDGRPLAERQQRFGHDVDGFLELVRSLERLQDDQVRVGMALHSLRAVPAEALRQVMDSLPELGSVLPIHIHIAEQQAEVEECMLARGSRPVAWLLDNAPVDFRWTLVHATHITGEEACGIAASGATVALCPTTEANLGDGLFPLRDFLDAGGKWGIGSDSHVSVSPVEELRWLEYGQRLRARRRNVAADKARRSVGEALYAGALAGGTLASQRTLGWLVAARGQVRGTRADLLVLDDQAPELAGRDTGNLLDSWIFSGNRPLVRDVYVGGRRVVADGQHAEQDRIAARYRATLRSLDVQLPEPPAELR